MKKSKRRKIEWEDKLFHLNISELEYVDLDKISSYSSDYTRDFKNYILFQRFPFFQWPLWLHCANDVTSNLFNPTTPLVLSNRINRNYIAFTSKRSIEEIRLDPSGMLSPTYDDWSIEFWIFADNRVHRPQHRLDRVVQRRDAFSTVVSTLWRERDFELSEEVYGIRTDVDEVLIEVKSILKGQKDFALLLLLVRPYNLTSISGIESVEYKKPSRAIGINHSDRIIASKNPDLVLTGNGSDGDIRIKRSGSDSFKCRCRYGMATLALGYKLGKGDNNFNFRVSLSKDRNIKPIKLNVKKLKNEFLESKNLRAKRGFTIEIPNQLFREWFYASKNSLLNCANPRNYYLQPGRADDPAMRSLFYITMGYNRMGYFEETQDILDSFLPYYSIADTKQVTDVVNGSYFLSALSDFFTISRNIDYLQSAYGKIKDIAIEIYQSSSELKNMDKWAKKKKNSIRDYLISSVHLHDVMLIAHALRQFSYLSRCIGLFGEEIKFNKEADRLEKIIIDSIDFDSLRISEEKKDEDKDVLPQMKDEFFVYNLFAGFPYRLNFLSEDNLRTLIEYVKYSFAGVPLFMRSLGGWDSFLSIITAINLLFVKDKLVYDILYVLMEAGKERFALPEVINPANGIGISGKGDSMVVLSLLFVLMRNALFIDHESRLEIFPVPREDWFVAGKEIVISNAPSRFGYLNFKIVTTRNEVQLHFNELPQYFPPDILINLPFRSRIIRGDDFLIKKEFGNSFLISGWPSVLRFVISRGGSR